MRSFTLLLLLYCSVWSLSAQTFPMDGSPITACSGFFTDSGGNNGDYQANEDYTTTICSDGSSGTHIKLIFSAPGIIEGDSLCFYDGTDTSAPLLSCHSDFSPNSPFIVQATAANTSGCLTVTFTSDGVDEGPGWSSIIECIAACQTIITTLASTDPMVSPPDTGYIDICPGDRVFFNAMGQYPQDGLIYNHSDNTSSFSWNFGDGTVAVGPNTSHVFDEPGGYIVQVEIEDQFGCTSTNFISQRIRVSTYPDFELAGVTSEGICAGDTVELNAFVNTIDSAYNLSVQPTGGSFVQAGALSDTLLLPDGTGASYQTSIGFTQFSPGAVLTDPEDLLGVSLFLEHSYGGDLDIELICPNGQSAYILDFPSGVGSTNFGEPWATGAIDGQSFDLTPGTPYEYTFVNSNSEYGTLPSVANNFNYTYTTVPSIYTGDTYNYSDNYFPAGTYEPVESFNNLAGCPLNGEWTIRVQDNLGLDNGWLFRWEIAFADELYPVIETFQPELVDWAWEQNSTIDYYSQDSISAILTNAGSTNYTFSVEDNFGCTYDTTVVITALPPTHPDCFNCETIITTIPDTSICSGSTATLSGSTNIPLSDQEVTFGASSGLEFDGSTFPPGNPIESAIAVDYVNPTTLTDPAAQIVSVCLNIEHNFDADVEIRLQAPNGVIIELSTDNGGSGDDYTNTCFTPLATAPITGGSAPFTGDWIPEGSWADLIGSPISGDWVLLVSDDQNGFGGEFIDWSITFNAINDITYAWSSNPTISCTNCPDPDVNPTQTTDYILNAIDAYGCVINDTVTVTVLAGFPAPDLTCGATDNGAITIDWLPIPGANSFEVSLDGGMTWSPALGNLSHTVFGLVDGDVVDILVQVDTVLNSSCPIVPGSIQCTYSDPCLFDLSLVNAQDPSCWNSADGLVTVNTTNAQAPVSYSLDGNASSNSPDFSNVSGGPHVVYAQDATGCIDSITIDLVAPDSIEFAFTATDASCFGDCSGVATVSASGGSGNINYTWNDAAMTNGVNATDLCTGLYTVVATDANGCTNSDTIRIGQPEVLTITQVNPTDVLCYAESTGSIGIVVEGGTGNYSYQWNDNNNQTSDIAQNLTAGIYTVLVTDANGCTAIDSAQINQPDTALSIVINQTAIGCADAMAGVAEVIPSGGTAEYSYVWNTGALSDMVANLSEEEYFVTVTDANGCEEEASIVISEYAPIVSTLSGTNPTCFDGDDGVIIIDTIFGGSGNYTIEWNSGALPSDSILMNLNADITYDLVITDSEGCEGVNSIALDNPAEIQVSVETTLPSCNGFNDGTATVINILGGNGDYTYLWDNNAGNQTDATALTLGSGSYEVTVTDADGCIGVSEVIIDEPTTMQLSFEVADVECPGEDGGTITVTTLGGVPEYIFAWDNGAGTATIENVSSGDYTVTVTDANGCFIEDVVSVESPEPLVAALEVNNVTCHGDDDGLIRVNMSGGTAPYLYSFDDAELSATNTLIRLRPGAYNILVQDANNCTWDETVSISEPDEFFVNAGPESVEIILGDSVQLVPGQFNSAGFVNYTWIEPFPGALSCDPPNPNGCDRPYAGPYNTTVYELYGIDENGCESFDEITVRVIKPRDVFVANGFTPNGDGVNDILMVHGPENTVVRQFRVFDRWGNKVYEYSIPEEMSTDEAQLVNDPNFGWDGNFREEPMGSGIYVWYVEVVYIDGFQKVFKGNTTILR